MVARASMRAQPSRLVPRHRSGRLASAWPGSRPVPHIRSFVFHQCDDAVAGGQEHLVESSHAAKLLQHGGLGYLARDCVPLRRDEWRYRAAEFLALVGRRCDGNPVVRCEVAHSTRLAEHDRLLCGCHRDALRDSPPQEARGRHTRLGRQSQRARALRDWRSSVWRPQNRRGRGIQTLGTPTHPARRPPRPSIRAIRAASSRLWRTQWPASAWRVRLPLKLWFLAAPPRRADAHPIRNYGGGKAGNSRRKRASIGCAR